MSYLDLSIALAELDLITDAQQYERDRLEISRLEELAAALIANAQS